mgnify:CR=1 FL=1
MAEPDFDVIMQEITSGLTGDPKADFMYLQKKAKSYKDSKYAQEIARACGRLMVEIMPEEQRAKLNQMTDNMLLGIKSVLEEAQFNMYKKNFNVAKEILVNAVDKIEQIDMYHDDAVSEYHTFNAPIEEILYVHLNEPKKDLRQAPEPLSALYLTLGSLLFELREYDDAKTALEKALHWNPMDADIAFEYAELFKVQGNMEEFYKRTMNIFFFAHKARHIARLYRNLGYYFVEKKMWRMAAACYLASTHFEQDSKQAQSELWYIQQKAGSDFTLPTPEEVQEYFRQYEIPLGADKDVVCIASIFGRQHKEQERYDYARYFYSIAYELTGMEEFKEILDDIPNE